MAVRYFDLNGATAGFGTLTGAWDTTSAFWSTSSAGTVAPTAYTFTNADTAQFGFTGTTATAGTATISTGITVTLNSITTANLAGLQTIAAAGTGAISLAGTTPTINVGSAGGLTISAPISGTAGLTFTGGNVLTLSGANTFTGAFTQSTGTTRIGNAGALGAAGATLALSGGTISSSSTTSYTITNAGASTISGNITLGDTTNTGTLTFANAFDLGASVRTLTINSNVALNGLISGSGGITKVGANNSTLSLGISGTNTFTGAFSGSAGITSGGSSTFLGPTTSTSGITSTGTHSLQFFVMPTYANRDVILSGTGSASNGALAFTQSGVTGTATFKSITLTGNASIVSNVSSGFTHTLTTGATAIALGANTLTLSNTSVGTFSVASSISGTGGVTVAQSSSAAIVNLSATSSNYTGATTVSYGILQVASLANVGVASSIGAPALANATINLGGSGPSGLTYTGTTNVSTDRILNLVNTLATTTLGTTFTGNVTYTSNLTVTGSGAKTLTFTGSSTGIVALSGVVPDSAGGATSISVTSGTHYLSGTANTLTGTTSVSGAGVLQFNSIGNVGAGASSLGNPALANATIALGSATTAGTIRYLGTGAASSDRVINLAGTTGGGGIEASGTGTLTFTSALTATGVGAKTFTLGGFTSGVFSGAITNASGNVISLTKSGSGTWSIPSASNTFTGNVSITGGPLTIEAANRLGGATKTVTISSTYRNASLVLAGTGDTLPSTTTLSVGSAGLDNLYFPQGAIKATSDWTVAGTVTQTTTSAYAADGGNLTLTGLVSGAFIPLFRAASGRTLYINAGLSVGTNNPYIVGPGTVEWKASAANAATSGAIIIGGTLRLVTDGAITNPFGASFPGFTFGVANASGTGNLYSRYAYTGGVAEIANTGAAGNVTLTLASFTGIGRGTATMRLNRASTAGVFQVNLAGLTTTTVGLFYWDYSGTPGTIGTDSKFVLTSTAATNPANTRILNSAISNGSALVPAYRDANRTVIPMVYDGSQATVLATQAGGSSLTGASATTNHNISANITAQPSTTISSLRMEAGTSLTLTSGSILETALLMDMGTSAGTVLSGGRLARSRSQSAELTTSGLQFYTGNTNGTGSTIASDIDLPYGTIFTKAGPGLVTHTGAISKLSIYNLAEGNAVFSSAGSFSGEYTGITFANPATGTNTLTLGTSGTVSVGYLSGGGANTTLALTGGDLKLTASSSGQIYSGNITRSGSQKLILRALSGTATASTATLSGSIDAASLDIQRGALVLPIETGASLASAIPVNFTGVGQITVGSVNPVPIGADYNLAFGPITVTQGLGRIAIPSIVLTTNIYFTRLSTSAVPTVAADGALDLPASTTGNSFTVTGASVGPMGINWFVGSSRAYYRSAGSLLNTGGYTPVATVDTPIYGTDVNFPPAKVAGTSFSAAPTDNVSVTGAQSAQTSVTVASLRSSATITMASASDRITTDLFIAATTTPISGGQIATNTGRLYVYSTGTPTISSALVDNGLTPTRLVLSGANSSVLTLTGTNTFSGGIALVGSGQLSAASDTNLGTGSIDSYGGDLNFSTAGSNTITKNIAVYDGGLYLTGSTAGVKLSGKISGTGDVFVVGGLTLQGANDNNGTLRLVGGTYLADATSLSNFAGIDFAGGTFRVTSASTPDISGKITSRTSNSIIISNASGTEYVLASSFGNSSTFTKGGVTGSTNDRVTLSAENYFTSATVGSTAAVGAVRAAATNALGWGTVTVQTGDVTATNQGAALELVGNITLPNAITLSGLGLSGLGAIRNVSGSNTLTGVITATITTGNNARIGADVGSSLTLSGGITATATGRIVEFVGAGTTVETGVISGGSFISVARPTGAGAGITRLLSANTYSGGTTLTEGTIFAGNQTALGTGSVTMASGTTLQSGTTGGQNGKLTVTGTLTNNGGTIRIGG